MGYLGLCRKCLPEDHSLALREVQNARSESEKMNDKVQHSENSKIKMERTQHFMSSNKEQGVVQSHFGIKKGITRIPRKDSTGVVFIRFHLGVCEACRVYGSWD